MSWQQGHEHAKTSDGEVDVEQPGQELEGVRGPAPAVSPRAQRHIGSVRTVFIGRSRAVRVPTAHIHPVQSRRGWSSSQELQIIHTERFSERNLVAISSNEAMKKSIECPIQLL